MGAVRRAVRSLARTAGPLLLRPRNWSVEFSERHAYVFENAGPQRAATRRMWMVEVQAVGAYCDEDPARAVEQLADAIRSKRGV